MTDNQRTPTEAEERVLRRLAGLCGYGFAPPRKVLAADLGISAVRVWSLLNKLERKKFVKRTFGCWHPTERGMQFLAEAS